MISVWKDSPSASRQLRLWGVRTIRSMGVGWRGLYVAPMILLTRFLAGRLRAPFARADVAWKYTASGMPKNYVLVARKPTHPTPA